MEKTINQDKQIINSESLILSNRKTLKLEGIIEVISTSETNLNLKLKETSLQINGENINILKLDVSSGSMEAEGKFNSIKYGNSGNIFKRIFK